MSAAILLLLTFELGVLIGIGLHKLSVAIGKPPPRRVSMPIVVRDANGNYTTVESA